MSIKRNLNIQRPDHLPEPEILIVQLPGSDQCVTVVLTGPQGCGKSVIAGLILEKLEKMNGIKIHNHNDPR